MTNKFTWSSGKASASKFFFILSLSAMAFLPMQKCMASHGMGGEITWTCLPGGQFIFEMKFYRDCNGIPGPLGLSMQTTVPGYPSIQMTLISQTDISPDGLSADGITNCANCTQGNGGNPIPGLVEEFIYRTAPVSLPGVPPANGWKFSWGDCCRSNSLTNVSNGGGIGFQNRAIMYPYMGTNNSPCFDSSPYFTEKPSVISCTGLQVEINSGAIDTEKDSLVYAWGNPLDDIGALVPFGPGYSVNSQLPSPTQNPNNVAAVLNPVTGEITFTSFTGGYFATVVKVTAYKCGIKVAEIFREINVVLNNNCPLILNNSINTANTAPTISAPFIDPNTSLQTSYVDTVSAGDTVNFQLILTDFDQFLNGTPQTITMEGFGAQFGLNFTDPDTGCYLPPCATIPAGLPQAFMIGGSVNFNWVTTCDHALGVSVACTTLANTYYFTIKAHDNYCPANAATVATITIVVMPAQTSVVAVSGASSICAGDTVVLVASGAQSYLWNTGFTGDSLIVTEPGNYSVIGSSPGSCLGTTSISVPIGSIQNVTASVAQTPACINWPPVPLTGIPAGGVWLGAGVVGNTINPAATGAGTFPLIYQVTDSLGCTGSDTIMMTVSACTGLDENYNEAGVFVYPNPAVDEITLAITNSASSVSTIELYNVYGQKVMDVFNGKIEQPEWKKTIDVSALPKGIYIFQLNGSGLQQSVFVK